MRQDPEIPLCNLVSARRVLLMWQMDLDPVVDYKVASTLQAVQLRLSSSFSCRRLGWSEDDLWPLASGHWQVLLPTLPDPRGQGWADIFLTLLHAHPRDAISTPDHVEDKA